MALQVVDKIPTPGLTISGKTTGPAVSLGRCRVGRGMPLFLHLSEFKDAARAFGWVSPDEHGRVAAELDSVRAELDTAGDRIADLEADLAKAVDALGIQFAPAAPKKPAKPEAEK